MNLTELHERNKRWRAWMDANTPFKTPDTLDCLRYALTEAAEAMDVWLREKNQTHARNNERNHSLHAELADTAMMLLTALPEITEFYSYSGPMDHALDYICLDIVECIMEELVGNPWDSCALAYIAAYSGFDLATELEACHTRLGLKHGGTVILDAIAKHGVVPWESVI
jgi:hypothetical protein